jgi:hypothetical protein
MHWDSSAERHWLCCVQVFTPGAVDYVALVSRVAALVLSSLYDCVSLVDASKAIQVSGKTPETSPHAETSRSERPLAPVTCTYRLSGAARGPSAADFPSGGSLSTASEAKPPLPGDPEAPRGTTINYTQSLDPQRRSSRCLTETR